MIGTVVGKYKKLYDFTDQKSGKQVHGMTVLISLGFGVYENGTDVLLCEGERFSELKCSEKILDSLAVGDIVYVELDDKKTRVKSAMLKIDDNSFVPIE